MNYSSEVYLILAILMFFLSVIIFCSLLIRRLKNDSEGDKAKEQREQFIRALIGKGDLIPYKLPLDDYLEMKKTLHFDVLDEERLRELVELQSAEEKLSAQLYSFFEIKRIEAAVKLGLIGTEKARQALGRAITREKHHPIKLHMANALADIKHPDSLPVLVSSLINSHRWYRERVNMLIADFGEAFQAYLPKIREVDQIELKELIVDFASVYYSDELLLYLENLIDQREEEINRLELKYGKSGFQGCSSCANSIPSRSGEMRLCKFKGEVVPTYHCRKYQILPISMYLRANYMQLVFKAVGSLAHFYPKVLDQEKYLKAPEPEIRNIAVQSLGKFYTRENFRKLLGFLGDDATARSAINAMSQIVENKPSYINEAILYFGQVNDPILKERAADILSIKLRYLAMKLEFDDGTIRDLLKEILILGKTSEMIDFLNKNQDLQLENRLIGVVREALNRAPQHTRDFAVYLGERQARKLSLNKEAKTETIKKDVMDNKLRLKLYAILVVGAFFFPAFHLIRYSDLLWNLSWLEHTKTYVLNYNYFVAYYSVTINSIYLILLVLGFSNVKRQYRLWKIKSNSLFFKRKILPSISIIAPAYNEEKTIIDTANSLLNLSYPDYELIIVNDSSTDNTLELLIQHYDLSRVDYIFEYKLNTQPVRGVYLNRQRPKLIVVDKENGGKADSLNVGINISKKEYFCGIDADSILEREALLKLASLILDEGVETPALGGNIFAINGCRVERGHITDIALPEKRLARLQSIEYLRAFMAGRLGWEKINGLMIVSGAFGLFRKERVIHIGGYMTRSGKYAKDTVGEDMELVVRITRLMREMKQKFRIRYAFNANCWTEVPEDLRSLKKQRYRWQKGLIDTMIFHRRMLLNPAYGRTGLLAMPYYIVFEIFGPLIELQGYLMVILAFVLGILNPEVVLLLFIATIGMGVLISMGSLFIAEKDLYYFKLKDLLLMIGYVFLENFGPRQYFSFWRVSGTFDMLKKPTDWEKPQRIGFDTSKTAARG